MVFVVLPLKIVKVPLNASFKSKPTFPAISIVVLFFLTSGLASTFGIVSSSSSRLTIGAAKLPTSS
jgi:hypothetical protein